MLRQNIVKIRKGSTLVACYALDDLKLISLQQNNGHFLNNQRGAVLLMLLICVALLGLLAGIAGSSWKTIVQRGKEEDLLWKGNQIRQAIGSYYEMARVGSATPKAFPAELDDLLKDPRFLETKRHLRQLYADPMTGEEWELIKAPGGGIMGVRSRSEKEPFKQDNFIEENKNFVGQQSYRDWQFVYKTKKKTPTGNLPRPIIK